MKVIVNRIDGSRVFSTDVDETEAQRITDHYLSPDEEGHVHFQVLLGDAEVPGGRDTLIIASAMEGLGLLWREIHPELRWKVATHAHYGDRIRIIRECVKEYQKHRAGILSD